MSDEAAASKGKRIPALVVSGFLGSGKTTLVRHLLTEAQAEGVRAAVVSNEFGELGIDQALLGEGEQAYVEIEGGCVCCKLGDELLDTLQMLYEKVAPDRIIVETSGVALPYDTLFNFWREPVRQWVADEASVVVVNAEQVALGRDLEGTFEDQVCSADLLLLNKTDLVTADDVKRAEELLRDMEPDAPLLHSVHGRVEPEVLFPPDPEGLRSARRKMADAPPPHEHEHFEAEEISIEAGIDTDELAKRLAALGSLRVKGFVETSEGPRLVQGVGHRIEFARIDGPPPERLLGRLVVIHRR